ncbi:MAG: Flp family type IVb pilin [Stellaceae bacterium]
MFGQTLRLLNDDRGVTAIEYGLIAALVAVVCIVAWQLLGTNLSTTFNNIAASV